MQDKEQMKKRISSYFEENRKNLVRTCSELIQIDSSNPPGDCTQVISYLRSEYSRTGADFVLLSADRKYLRKLGHEYPRHNFISRIGPKKNLRLAIGTHMDVVPAGDREKWKFPPFSGSIANSKIWGRGAVDAKCSLASQLYAVKAIAECEVPLDGGLACIGTVDDEAPGDAIGAGMEYVVDKGMKRVGINVPRFAINAEASGLRNIWGRFAGGLTVRMKIRGKTGHPPIGVNALDNAAAMWSSLLEKRNKNVFPIAPKLVWLNGGTESDFGLTPVEAKMIFRVPILDPRVSTEAAFEEIKRVIRDEKAKNPSLIVDEVVALRSGGAFDIGRKNPLVQILKNCAKEAGVVAQYGGGIVGPGDLQFFLERGVSAVTFGAGSLDRCHVPNEYITIAELVAQSKIYALASLGICMP